MIRCCSVFEGFIITLMVGAGSLITIVLKWADQLESLNSIGENVPFSHPFLQSTFMFLGELFCIALFYAQRCWRKKHKNVELNKEKNVQNTESTLGSESHLVGNTKKIFLARSSWILIPASICDMTGISLSYFALTLTSVSSYEMLKGSVIIFTGINSKLFLKRQMSWKKWSSMIVILIGLIIVGLADVLQPAGKRGDGNNSTINSTFDHTSSDPEVDAIYDTSGIVLSHEVVGDIMIVVAQIFMSFQFVYEEKVLSSYTIAPLQAVGWEGLYGLIIMSILLIPLSYINLGSCIFSNSPTPPWTLEDPIDGFIQLGNNGLLLFLFCSYVLLVAFYMYGSIAVTKRFNATTRMVLESSRSVIVWVVSLCVGWQHFQYLQLIGFCVMTIGIFLYNYKWKK